MGGKAKKQKHTKKEIDRKIASAKARNGGVGGGKAGMAARTKKKLK